MTNRTGQELWEKAKKIIPGGNQLLSKRCEMFLPNQWPAYYSRAKGCEVWDLDQRHYLDTCIMGVGSCLLGYADDDVNRAVKMAVENGVMCTLNPPDEVRLAELLCEIHPWAEMVRYGRSGGEAMSMAIRIARAASGKDKIAFCGYHGWCDWYLAANLEKDKNLDGHLLPGLQPNGVPRGLQGTALPFFYNRIDQLEEIIEKHSGEIGAIVMEPARGQEPKDGFLEKVREYADKETALLIFDEITLGWKMTLGGAHLLYDVKPDMAIFAKAMSNGFAMSAIIGTKPVMEAAQESFISSTNWTEAIGPAAALATIDKMKRVNLSAHIKDTGSKVKNIWIRAAENAGLKINIGGLLPVISFSFDAGDESQALKTLFVQEMLDKGYLASNMFFSTLAHTDKILLGYEEALNESFVAIKTKIEQGAVKSSLRGPVAHSGFYRLT